ncbi:MAG: hypothetical protein LBC42_00160 [Puniceicoccales bacterium]|nr:hypothetical protein [Puniceicoccales bacterium]
MIAPFDVLITIAQCRITELGGEPGNSIHTNKLQKIASDGNVRSNLDDR